MNARWCLATFCIVLLPSALLAQEPAIPLAVQDGHCAWVHPAQSSPCFLIVGSLAPSTKIVRVSIQSEPTSATVSVPSATVSVPREPNKSADNKLTELTAQAARLSRVRQASELFPPSAEPPRRKTFALFTGERELENAGNYATISAELRAVGKHVQVYLDVLDPMTTDLDQTIADALRTFDQEVLPWSREKLGHVADVDRDGRFTILMSSRLARMQGGKVSLDGFVRGSDFVRDIGPPFGNRCDMMYLNAHLKPGPHLRTVLAHEFTHAVTFCEHVLNNPPGHRNDEESWLSEGLSHLVEDLHQHGWTNLDYRISTYLSQPERYPLVVPDYFASGLWRTPGTRGSVYLFLRWCHLHAGQELPRRLIQSPLVGTRNLENATGQTFAELYRAWAVSLIREESWRVDQPIPGRLARPRELSPLPGRPQCGPSFTPLAAGSESFDLAGTGLKFIYLPSLDKNRRLRIQADKDSRLQATLVPVDARRGWMNLSCRVHTDNKSLIVEAFAHGSPLHLRGVSWEKVGPSTNMADQMGERELPGALTVEAGGKRSCTVTDFLPPQRTHDLIIRTLAQDAQGRPVVGVAYLPIGTSIR